MGSSSPAQKGITAKFAYLPTRLVEALRPLDRFMVPSRAAVLSAEKPEMCESGDQKIPSKLSEDGMTVTALLTCSNGMPACNLSSIQLTI